NAMWLALLCQIILLVYHQLTTLLDLHPFNGARFASRTERWAESAVNLVLMSLAPIGFAFGIRGLMWYGVIYYPILFWFEIVILWLPYFPAPPGRWLRVYNVLLGVATTSIGDPDALANWTSRHLRLHHSTITILPTGRGPILPNLEHMILHAWTAVTAIATLAAIYFGR